MIAARKESVEELCERHAGWARGLAARKARRVPPWITAGDLECEALWGLWQASQRWQPERGAFRSYAYTRVMGAMADYLRQASGGRRRQRLTREYPLSALPDGWPEPAAAEPEPDDFPDTLTRLCRHTSRPELAARVLDGYYRHGLTQREIAAGLGCSESYVSLLHKRFTREIRGEWTSTETGS